MIRQDAEKPAHLCDGLTRRGLLQAGTLGLLGLTLSDLATLEAEGALREERSCILLLLVGGPSQLDTWDMKPNAPAEIRGPYRPIPTNVPGIEISEIFPRMARHADKYAIIRTLHHSQAAIHDLGHQVMQTGYFFEDRVEHPHLGCVVGRLRGARGGMPPHVLLPGPLGLTGGNMPQGQSAGYLGVAHDPVVLDMEGRLAAHRFQNPGLPDRSAASVDLTRETEATRRRYGVNRFGQSCLMARRLIESGVRFVTVNMFETVFNEVTWDIHGAPPFSSIEAYGERCGPWFDSGFTALIEDLSGRGLLESTLVVATGEFGRTPRINRDGGRDHWPQCWSMLLAGGGVKGGRVVGVTDEIASEPVERPVTPAEVAATVYYSLGINPRQTLPGPQGRPIPLVPPGAGPIMELF